MELSQLEDLFNHPGWEVFRKELDRVYENADGILHTPSRKDDREVQIGKCQVIKEIRNMEAGFRKDIENSRKES
jgi:hypothetical protein